MRDPGEMVTAGFPRPGPALKAVLVAIAGLAIAGAVLFNWGPLPLRNVMLEWMAFQPARVWRAWTLLTSGLLTSPQGISHALWSLVGLYFLTPELERRWGSFRLLRFLGIAVVFGNLAATVAMLVPPVASTLAPQMTFGPLAAITATAIGWAKEHKHAQIRFFFFLPMSGRTLYWVTIGLAALAIVFNQATPEGPLAPLGGVVAGLLFGGTPSPARTLWLRLKLLVLRRRGEQLTVSSIMAGGERPRPKRPGKGPPLRVVHGGLEDELKNRKPPKDKRYLN